jgi:hypothetical protein
LSGGGCELMPNYLPQSSPDQSSVRALLEKMDHRLKVTRHIGQK